MREKNPITPVPYNQVGLPPKPFLYTMDQIATLLSLSEDQVRRQYIWYDGRSTGSTSVHLMIARNIAKPGATPEWRVADRELVRWMRVKGFKLHTRAMVGY